MARDTEVKDHLSRRALFYVLLGTAAILYYTQVGHKLVGDYYFGRSVSIYFHFLVVCLIALLSLTAIGCSLHLKTLGGFQREELDKDVTETIANLKTIVVRGQTALAELEKVLPKHAYGISPRGSHCQRVLKQIINCVETRIKAAQALQNDGHTAELCQAVELLNKKIRSVESAQKSLIDTDPFPAVPVDQLSDTVDTLISGLQSGLNRAA